MNAFISESFFNFVFSLHSITSHRLELVKALGRFKASCSGPDAVMGSDILFKNVTFLCCLSKKTLQSVLLRFIHHTSWHLLSPGQVDPPRSILV